MKRVTFWRRRRRSAGLQEEDEALVIAAGATTSRCMSFILMVIYNFFHSHGDIQLPYIMM
jgi:hypothetical protein